MRALRGSSTLSTTHHRNGSARMCGPLARQPSRHRLVDRVRGMRTRVRRSKRCRMRALNHTARSTGVCQCSGTWQTPATNRMASRGSGRARGRWASLAAGVRIRIQAGAGTAVTTIAARPSSGLARWAWRGPFPARGAMREDVLQHARVKPGLLEMPPARRGHLTLPACHQTPRGQPAADLLNLRGALKDRSYELDARRAPAEDDHRALDRMQRLPPLHRMNLCALHHEQLTLVQRGDRTVHHMPGPARQERDVIHVQGSRLARSPDDPPEHPPHTSPPSRPASAPWQCSLPDPSKPDGMQSTWGGTEQPAPAPEHPAGSGRGVPAE